MDFWAFVKDTEGLVAGDSRRALVDLLTGAGVDTSGVGPETSAPSAYVLYASDEQGRVLVYTVPVAVLDSGQLAAVSRLRRVCFADLLYDYENDFADPADHAATMRLLCWLGVLDFPDWQHEELLDTAGADAGLVPSRAELDAGEGRWGSYLAYDSDAGLVAPALLSAPAATYTWVRQMM
jgi:hypothetical protein